MSGAQEVKPPGTVPGFVYEKWAAELIARVYLARTGVVTDCQDNQSRKLWIAGGPPDENGVIHCTVPFGTPIFMQWTWAACTNVEQFPFFGATDADARACAQRFIQRHLRSVGISIDGRKVYGIRRFLITTDPFDVAIAPDNAQGLPAGPARGVGQGYFFYIAPPPRGVFDVTLNSDVGVYGKFKLTYRFTIV